MGPLASASVIGTPSFSNIFWKDKTGAKTPASHTVPVMQNVFLSIEDGFLKADTVCTCPVENACLDIALVLGHHTLEIGRHG